MTLTAEQLNRYWEVAQRPETVTIVGAGRWGRVWASVLGRARGGAAGIVLVARSNAPETRDWAGGQNYLKELTIADSIDSADPAVAAIIASRPRDHVRDAIAMLDRGAAVLVEKPIASDPDAAERLIAAATKANRLLAVNVEFGLLQEFHSVAAAFDAESLTAVEIEWHDPHREIRHGAEKRDHDEINLLEDLLPHALSILRIFMPSTRLRVEKATLDLAGTSGEMIFSDGSSRRHAFRCSKVAARRRMLKGSSGHHTVEIDFNEVPAEIRWLRGNPVAIKPASTERSLLRLAWGAFMSQALGLSSASPLSANLQEHVRLLQELRARVVVSASEDG